MSQRFGICIHFETLTVSGIPIVSIIKVTTLYIRIYLKTTFLGGGMFVHTSGLLLFMAQDFGLFSVCRKFLHVSLCHLVNATSSVMLDK